jgi:type 1 glutamine amidotransferase
MQNLNRRDVLKLAGAAAALAVHPFAIPSAWCEPAAGSRKRILFFTKSAGFQHSVITRPKDDRTKLSYAEQILTDLGASNGFDVVCSKDGNVIAPGSIEQFDVFAFYTTGDLTKDSDKFDKKKGPDGKDVSDPEKLLHKEPAMPAGAKEALLEAISAGKGFIGFHCAADTFHSRAHSKDPELLRNVNEKGEEDFDPYIRMLGGEFIVHGKQQPATLKATDPKWPGAAAFDGARFVEEWYALKNFAPDLHVILAQDNTGMEGPMYQRPPFPETWARVHGKGRVFYTSMGHREDVWTKPEFVALVVGALNWASGRIEADVTANISRATLKADSRT